MFTDSFDTSLISWTASFTGTGATAAKWKTVTTTADRAYNPSSLYSAWPAADGLQAGDPNSGNYPNNLNSWMIHGPIDLSTKKAAEIYYSQNYDIEDGDWLGFCIRENAPTPDDFSDDNCSWQGGGQTNDWEYAYEDLSAWAGASNIYIAFVFQSDGSNAANHAGPFIDEVQLWANDQEVDPTDPGGDFVDWTGLRHESFSPATLSSAPWKLDATTAGAKWSTTSVKANTDANPASSESASPTAGGSYSAAQRAGFSMGRSI